MSPWNAVKLWDKNIPNLLKYPMIIIKTAAIHMAKQIWNQRHNENKYKNYKTNILAQSKLY